MAVRHTAQGLYHQPAGLSRLHKRQEAEQAAPTELLDSLEGKATPHRVLFCQPMLYIVNAHAGLISNGYVL